MDFLTNSLKEAISKLNENQKEETDDVESKNSGKKKKQIKKTKTRYLFQLSCCVHRPFMLLLIIYFSFVIRIIERLAKKILIRLLL